MERWEYKFFAIEPDSESWDVGGKFDSEEATKQLNRLGADGREVVASFDPNQSGGITRDIVFLLKRPFTRNS